MTSKKYRIVRAPLPNEKFFLFVNEMFSIVISGESKENTEMLYVNFYPLYSKKYSQYEILVNPKFWYEGKCVYINVMLYGSKLLKTVNNESDNN